MMILKSEGFTLYGQYVPPFEMQEGEVITINIGNNRPCGALEFALLDIFSGKQAHPNVIIHKPITLVPYFRDNSWRRWFRKTKVSHIFKRYQVPIETQEDICRLLYVKSNTPINSLAGSSRKQIMWYSALATNPIIVIGLAGMDPKGVENAYQYTQQHLNPKGGAIIINVYGEDEGEGYSHQIINCSLIPLSQEEMQTLIQQSLGKECIGFDWEWMSTPIAYLENKQKYAILEVLKDFAEWVVEQAPQEYKEMIDFPVLVSYMHGIGDNPVPFEEERKELGKHPLLGHYFLSSEFLSIYHFRVIVNICIFCIKARNEPYQKLLNNIRCHFMVPPDCKDFVNLKNWTPRNYPECVKFLELIEKHYAQIG